MNIEDIKKLVELVGQHEIAQIEVEMKGVKVRITGQHRPAAVRYMLMQGGGSLPASAMSVGEAVPAPAPSHAPAPAAPAVQVVKEAEPEGCPPGCIEIKSPMVGTFYRASSPEAPSFVEVGDKVSEDTTLCILEAMKLMNEIKAEMKGVVRKVLVENGQPIEYGQVLFYIEKH
jgi:acetyl-CoA carboxylase biotin carboxyl carrier protein